jgi:Alw26I/Eco31I/Esp3I family type II restriction m6 adenine DNA methyltransferase
LGDGFLYLIRQNPELARRWHQRQGSTAPIEQYLDSDELLRTIYEESLTLLYRLLFLFYAESRDLLPMHDELYRDTYSLEALRDDIISVHDDPDPRRFFSQGATDLDVRLRELFGLIDVGFGNLIPAYNGGLFDPEQHPFLESFKVGDYYLARAIDLLSRTRPQNGQVRGEGRKKVTYRDLDVRHLGEIYEGLLEYSAHIAREEQVIFERKKNNQKYEEYVAASELSATERRQLEEYRRARAENPEFPSLPRGCSVTGVKEPGQYFLVYGGKESKRKSSGSYYTPDYIVQYIVENTLGPLVRGENREGDKQNVPLNADEILNLKVLDPAMGSGHFLVAATEYLARAYGQALIREGRDSDGAMSDAEFIRYKRMVAERCIYGVDINPMAVELAKLSLWLFTMDPQRPLSFLDHHLKCGNALIGAWIKDLGALPDTKQHPDQLNLFEARFEEKVKALVDNVFEIMHRETLSREDIADKKALDHAVEELKRPFRTIADSWVATYFGEQARDYDAWLINPEDVGDYESKLAVQHRFFHWELEFPEIWFDQSGIRRVSGGFSAVLGNPPYDVLEKDRGGDIHPHEILSQYGRNRPQYAPALGGKLNLFRFFSIQSVEILRTMGRIGVILPLALLADISCAPARKFIIKRSMNLECDCFPQKDDPNRRVFREAKLSTAIIIGWLTDQIGDHDARIVIRVYPWNSFNDTPLVNDITLRDVALLDPENIPIPLVDEASWRVCKKIHLHPMIKRMGDVEDITINRGEINQTIFREFIVSDPTKARLIKGAEVGKFHLRTRMSQGEREWLDEERYLRENLAHAKVNFPRIATQRITGVDERMRIVAAIAPRRSYFADSTNSIALNDSSPYSLEYIAALLNSKLFQWRFRMTSTNNNVGTNEIEAMPFRIIDFDDVGEKNIHDHIVRLTRSITDLLEKNDKIDNSKMHVSEITRLEEEINTVIYQTYNLEPGEVSIIESSFS